MSAAAVPALSRIANDRETYRQFLLQSFAMLAFVGMGLGACLTLVGNDLVIVLLGSKWVEAGKIFQFFAPGIGAVFLYGPWGWIPLSIGRAERYSRWGLVELVVTALLFFVAIPWGVKGIAAAWSASYWLLALPATWYAGRPIGFGVGQVLEAVWKYILAAVAAARRVFPTHPSRSPSFLGCRNHGKYSPDCDDLSDLRSSVFGYLPYFSTEVSNLCAKSPGSCRTCSHG